jgi:hypothetical protein
MAAARTGRDRRRHRADRRGHRAAEGAGAQPHRRFLAWDATDLAALGERWQTVLDCGVFHVFDDTDRPRYVASLTAAVEPGGRYHMLVFSDRQSGTLGPRRISQAEIRASFADGWSILSIEPAILETNAGFELSVGADLKPSAEPGAGSRLDDARHDSNQRPLPLIACKATDVKDAVTVKERSMHVLEVFPGDATHRVKVERVVHDEDLVAIDREQVLEIVPRELTQDCVTGQDHISPLWLRLAATFGLSTTAKSS